MKKTPEEMIMEFITPQNYDHDNENFVDEYAAANLMREFADQETAELREENATLKRRLREAHDYLMCSAEDCAFVSDVLENLGYGRDGLSNQV